MSSDRCLVILFEDGKEAERFCLALEKESFKKRSLFDNSSSTDPPFDFELQEPEEMLISRTVKNGRRVIINDFNGRINEALGMVRGLDSGFGFEQAVGRFRKDAPVMEIVDSITTVNGLLVDLSYERLKKEPDYWRGRTILPSDDFLYAAKIGREIKSLTEEEKLVPA
jgi:hypothetical protein